MKKIIIIIIVILAAGLISYTLYNNKKEMTADAKAAMKTSKAIPVEIEKASFQPVTYHFTASGSFIPAHVINLVSEAQGSIVRIYHEKGDHVKAGEVIVKIDDTLLQAQLPVVQANYDKAKKDLERFTNLAGTEAITQRQLEDAKLALTNAESDLITIKKRIADTSIKSPVSGIINDDSMEPGKFVNVGMQIAEIVSVTPLKLELKVAESEVSMINTGDSINVYTAIDPQKFYPGEVTFVATKGDASLKYTVEITLGKMAADKIKPGMYGYANFDYDLGDNSLVISKKAIVGGLDNPQVFVADGNAARLKEVKVMPVDEKSVRVVSGLQPGEEVIVSGQINLKDGREISIM